MTILKKSLNLYENCRDTETGSSVHNYMIEEHYLLSAESYSAQLHVRNVLVSHTQQSLL